MINPWLEWTAVALSTVGVWMMVQRRLIGWPLGLVAVCLYTVIFYQAKLYSDALLQLVFGGFVIYGWLNWRRQTDEAGKACVDPLPRSHACRDVAIGLAAGLGLGASMAHYTDAHAPWLDALLACLSLVAQWWQARRHAAAWAMWLSVDLVYIGLYASRDLHATALLYLLFALMAARGWYSWNQALRQA